MRNVVKGLVGMLVAGALIGGCSHETEEKRPRFLSYDEIHNVPEIFKKDEGEMKLFPNAVDVGYDRLENQFYVDGLFMNKEGMFVPGKDSRLYLLEKGVPGGLEEDWVSFGEDKYPLTIAANGDSKEPQIIIDGSGRYLGKRDTKEGILVQFPSDGKWSKLKVDNGNISVSGNCRMLNGDLLINYDGIKDVPKVERVREFDLEFNGKKITQDVEGKDMIPVRIQSGKSFLSISEDGSYQIN